MTHRLLPGLTSIAFVAALLVFQTPAVSQGGPAVSLPIQDCLDKDDGTTAGDINIIKCAEKNRLKDVLFFNHQDGRILYPAPAQLEVEDGAVFTIVFLHTDPTSFDYTLKGLSGPDDKAANFKNGTDSKQASKSVTVFVTWRHDRHFPLYQVQLSIRKAAQTDTTMTVEQIQAAAAAKHLTLVPKEVQEQAQKQVQEQTREQTQDLLFEYTFPVWVKTAGWNITFNSGFGFSSLTSKKYFIATDAAEKKTVEVDPNRGDQSRPDIMALANLTLPHLKNPSLGWAGEKLGFAFGIGLGGDSDARYYFGPSYTLGKRFILNGGWTGGKVSTLPVGQRLHEAPISGDNTLGTLGSRFAHGWYLGISFTFTPDKETEFLGALTPPQKTGEGTPAPKENGKE
jgi:Tfp pilus assembly major pilin PilA